MLTYLDYDAARGQPRPREGRQLIMAILLDLVEVSLDTEGLRDVRRRRSFDELAQADTARAQLINELVQARLLSKRLQRHDGGAAIVVVDIIHESLIANWSRLREAIAEQRELLQQRARFEAALREWLTHRDRPDAYQYQLRGRRLLEAVALRRRGDIALMSADARTFLAESEEGPGKTELLLEEQFNRAESQRLAFAARDLPPEEAETALLLACEAVSWHHNVLSEQVLRDSIDAIRFPDMHHGDWLRLAFSPDGSYALVGSTEATGLWTGDGQLVATLPGARHLGFSPDGSRCWILLQSNFQQTQVFALDGSVVASLSGEQIAFSRDGLMATAHGSVVRLWDADGHQLDLLTGHTANVTSLSFSPDGQRLATAQAPYGEARLWERIKPWPPTLHGAGAPLSGARYTGNDAYVLTAEGANGQLTIWSAEGEQIAALPGEGGGFTPCSSGAGGQRLLTIQSNTARLWELPPNAGDDLLAKLLGPHTGQFKPRLITKIPASTAWLSPDARRILAASDKDLTLWDDRGRQLATLDGEPATPPFTPDGHILTYGSISEEGRRTKQRDWEHGFEHLMYGSDHEKQREARLWSPDGVIEALIPFAIIGGRNSVDAIIISPDGERILFVEEHSVQLYDIPTGRMKNLGMGETIGWPSSEQATYKVEWAVFSPDSKRFLTGSTNQYNKGVKLWDRDGVLVKALEGSDEVAYNTPVSFSSDGRLIAVNLTKEALVFTSGGERLGMLRGHNQRVHNIVFSPDSKHALTASEDNTARLWRIDGPLVSIFRGHTAAVKSAVFSSDGRRVLTASDDGTARQFVVNANDLLVAAAQRVGRELTDEEIERFLVSRPVRFSFANLGGGYSSSTSS